MLLTFSVTDNIRLDRIFKHSECLGNDIITCYQRLMSNPQKWGKSEATIANYIRIISVNIDNVVEHLEKESLIVLLEHGLAALKENKVWSNLEYTALNSSERYGNCIKNAFLMLFKAFYDNPNLLPPSKIDLKGYVTDIAKLYRASGVLFYHYRAFLLYLVNSERSQKTLRDIKASTHVTLVQLLKNEDYRKILGEHGFGAFSINNALWLDATRMERYNSVHFHLMLSHYDSKAFERKCIFVRGKYEIDLTDMYRVSPAIYQDLKNFSKIIGHSVGAHLKTNSVRDRFSAFKRALPLLQAVLTEEINKALLNEGMIVLVRIDNLLRELHHNKKLPSRTFLLLHEVCRCLYPERTPSLSSFRDNLLSFPNVDRNRELLCDFSSIKAISERMYDDFVDFLGKRKLDIEQKHYSMVSVYHNYQQIKSLVNKYSETFNPEHLQLLREHGIQGFGVNGGLVQKHLLAELQSDVNENSLNRRTAHTYRSSFIWLMREFSISFHDVYPIKVSRAVRHNQRLKTDDFYTEAQCREIAFFIETLLRDEKISLYYKILLHFGKVVLKTGWNISPLLNLECDDIVEVESPITNRSEYAVVLQKARGGYRNDTYMFDNRGLKNQALKSAITDILEVRDNLTKDIRTKTKHCNFVFIFPRNGKVSKLEYAQVKYLSKILRRAGCRTPFVAQKIRRGGVNHIYRKVQKNIKEYTDTISHSFSVFESNYLRLNADESRYSLSQATKIMADYFTGKEISSDIHIITDLSTNQTQVVPTGTCAAKVNSSEAKRYSKEHYKLRSESSGSRLCADFLSCVWCQYFRIVLDSEHVWKLLSYKHFILQNMAMSVLEFDDTNHQRTSIQVLKQRVDDIVEHLRARDTKVVSDGFMLLEKHGIHPDWEFACPSMAAVKGAT